MSVYLEAVQVNSFRGIHELFIKNLNHINIIAGDNNSGKTSILEALMLFRNPAEFSNVLRVARLRDVAPFLNNTTPYESFINLFPHNEAVMEISLAAKCLGDETKICILGQKKMILLDQQELRKKPGAATRGRMEQMRLFDNDAMETECFSGELRYTLSGQEYSSLIEFHPFTLTTGREINKSSYLNMVYLSPVDHTRGNVFNRILRNDAYKDICLHILRLFDPEIKDLLMLKNDTTGRPVEYVKHAALGTMPLSTYGDGIKKVLSLANGIAQAASGILLIDEVETAIHSKYYSDIFRFIVKACKQFDVQAFITTHSIEAIDGLLATQDYDKQDLIDDISVLTFKKESASHKTYSRVLTGRHVHVNREQFDFEVRL